MYAIIYLMTAPLTEIPQSLERYLAGRYPPLTPEQQDFFIDGIIANERITDLCKKLGLAVHDYYAYYTRYPEFAKKVEYARIAWTHQIVDELNHVADDAETMADAQIARVKSDNIQWIAGKMIPSKYGDTINVNVEHKLDLGPILQAAQNRVIEVKAEKVTPEDAPQSTISRQLVVLPQSNESRSIDKIDLSDVPSELLDLI